MGKNAQSFPCVRTILPETLGQAKAELVNVVAVEQSWLDARESTIVRPGLTKNWMHAAVVNRLHNNFNITKPWHRLYLTNNLAVSWAMANSSSLQQRGQEPGAARCCGGIFSIATSLFHLNRECSAQRNCREHECVTVPCRNLRTIDLTTLTISLSPS